MKFTMFKFGLGACAIMLSTSAFAGTACTSTSSEADHTGSNAANGEHGYCFHTPQQLNLVIYEFGLCKDASSPADRAPCTALFSDTGGRAVNLSVGAVDELIDNISIDEGTYTHAYLIASNETSVKSVIEFSTARTDDQGNSGKFCYTDGRSWDNNPPSIMSCGSTAANAVASVETIALYGANNSHMNTMLDYTVSQGGQSIVSDLYMIASDGTLSTGFANDFALYASQRLLAPVDVSVDTKNIDVAFSITDGVAIGFDTAFDLANSISASTRGPNDAVWEGLQFIITAQ